MAAHTRCLRHNVRNTERELTAQIRAELNRLGLSWWRGVDVLAADDQGASGPAMALLSGGGEVEFVRADTLMVGMQGMTELSMAGLGVRAFVEAIRTAEGARRGRKAGPAVEGEGSESWAA